MRLLAILVFICAFSALTQGRKFHIIAGTEANAHSRPWMLSIEKSGGHNCGAALVRTGCSASSSNVAVTAAHCFKNEYCRAFKDEIMIGGGNIFMVDAGKHNLSEVELGQQSRKIVAVECHPHGWVKHDIAVFKLESPIEFSDTIKPIELPKYEQVPDSDAICSFTGWGDTDKHHGRVFPETLQALGVKPRSAYCAKDRHFNADAMFCIERARPSSDGDHGTTCHADSGSPVICSDGKDSNETILFGLIRGPLYSSPGCAHPGQAARVSHYVPWLQEKIHTLAGCE